MPYTIPVYICVDTFQTWLPQLPIAEVRITLLNVLNLWNVYGGVDFRMTYAGDRYGTGNGCNRFSWPANGEITLYAQKNAGNGRACKYGITGSQPGAPTINRSAIGLNRDCNINGTAIAWTMDYRETNGTYTDVTMVLTHEVGHAIGFSHECSGRVSTMAGGVTTAMRVLWPTDVYYLTQRRDCYSGCTCADVCDTSCPLVPGYSRVTTRQIEHKRSVDTGMTWTAEGNLLEYSNTPVSVTWGTSAYALAWKEPADGFEQISTILGNGLYYWSKSTNLPLTHALTGPAITYGDGVYLLEWVTSLNDERHIWYRISSDGVGWGSPGYLYFRWLPTDNALPYGSMREPSVAHLSAKGYFITAWTQWRSEDNFAERGEVSVCLNPDPSTQAWRYCRGLGYYANASPTLVCHPSENRCLIAWTDRMPAGGNRIVVAQASINWDGTGDRFDFIPGTIPIEIADWTKNNPALAYGNAYWLLGWRGDDWNTTGMTKRELDGTFPAFGDWAFPDYPLMASPAVVFGPSWYEFAFYYTKR